MPQLIVKLKGRELQRSFIRRTVTTVGRDPSCDVVLDNIGVSRQHCRVEFQDGTFYAVDSGSSNGIFVNGSPRRRHPLMDGDEIMIGKFVISFTSAGGVPVDQLDEVAGPEEFEKPPKLQGANPTTALSPEEIKQLSTRLQEAEREGSSLVTAAPPIRSELLRARREREALQRRSRWLLLLLTFSVLAIGGLVTLLLLQD